MTSAVTAAKAIQDHWYPLPPEVQDAVGVVLARLNEAITHLEAIRVTLEDGMLDVTMDHAEAALALLRNEDAPRCECGFDTSWEHRPNCPRA